MKTKITLLLLCSLAFINAYAQQDFDRSMSVKAIGCPEIADNAAIQFTRYIREEKRDSARLLLDYWKGKCGNREPIRRAEIMLAMVNGQFTDSLLGNDFLADVYNYRKRMALEEKKEYIRYDYGAAYFGFVPPGQDFDRFSMDFFKAQMQQQPVNSMSYLLSEFYGTFRDTLLYKIQDSSHHDSKLYGAYMQVVHSIERTTDFHAAALAGIWIPTGDLKILGSHPEIGIQGGVKKGRMNYDLTMKFRFLKSADPYSARRVHSDNNVVQSTHFFGGYMGIDAAYDLFIRRAHELQAGAGAGIDGFDAIKEDNDKNIKAESILSYNFNFGISYRYYTSPSGYLGLGIRYNIVDYTLRNIVDFSGSPVTITLSIGGLSNKEKVNTLRYLSYRKRRF